MAAITFYGPLSDIMGRNRSVEICAGGVSIRGLIETLEQGEPEFRAALSRMCVKFARNDVIVAPDEKVFDGDNIAVLPPFSGG
jgi:molybdopterin converting factor small subunit